MKEKPISEIVTLNNNKRFEPLYKCRCPKCKNTLNRKDEICKCGQEIDWTDWQ